MSERHDEVLVDVRHLKQYFNINTGWFRSKPLKAVDDVSFSIKRAKRWVWSANPAAAKRPSAARYCTFTSPPAATCSLTAGP